MPAEEARLLLAAGLGQPAPAVSGAALLALAQTLFGPHHGVDLQLPPRDPGQDRPEPDFA